MDLLMDQLMNLLKNLAMMDLLMEACKSPGEDEVPHGDIPGQVQLLSVNSQNAKLFFSLYKT